MTWLNGSRLPSPLDEVLVSDGSTVALVHLTWSGKPEQPPSPVFEFVTGHDRLRLLVDERFGSE